MILFTDVGFLRLYAKVLRLCSEQGLNSITCHREAYREAEAKRMETPTNADRQSV